MKNNKALLAWINIVFPLFIGLLLYVFTKPNSYISLFVSSFLSVPAFSFSSWWGIAINNWGCDFLWAYSLCSAFAQLFRAYRYSCIPCALLTFVLGAILELLQLFEIVSGTFDFWDIIFEMIAVIVSSLINYLFKGELE